MPKKSNQTHEKFRIKLTELQRETLVACTHLDASIMQKIERTNEGTQSVEFTRKELGDLHDALGEAAVSARCPHKRRIASVYKKVFDILDGLTLAEFGLKQPSLRHQLSGQTDLLFQFKISLLDTHPAIWRRIQVRDCTLSELHDYIQTAMGWEDCHMHQFEIDGNQYGPISPVDFDFGVEWFDESDVLLSQLVPASGKRSKWLYVYDFGDDWRHSILFEGHPPVEKKAKYPRCVEGGRACPPEDVGGPWSYAELLEAIADPDNERHEEFLEWCGQFDPNEFESKKTTRQMWQTSRRNAEF